MSDYAILSVLGPHAGEGVSEIIDRKRRDIETVGFALWVIHSSGCRLADLRALPAATPVYFIASAAKNGARPTTCSAAARLFDGRSLPPGLSPVTGRLPGYALHLTELEPEQGIIDLNQFSLPSGAHVRFSLGRSTVIVRHQLAKHGVPMLSTNRPLVAVGRVSVKGGCAVCA